MTGFYTVPDFGPSDLLTDDRPGIRRLSVDSQQTSFEANEQFQFFASWDEIPNNNQIVYRVDVGSYAVNVFSRSINIASGGRKYRAYIAGNGESFTGTLSDESQKILPVNSNLNPTLSQHPASDVTVWSAQGIGIFSAGTNDKIIGGATVLTDSNANRASTAFSPETVRLGVASGAVVWLVFYGISPNGTNTDGEFKMIWEERLSD